MNYLMLFITVCGVFFQNVWKKQFNQKGGSSICASFMFNIVLSFSALAFFIIVSKGSYTYHLPTILRAILFTAGYIIGTVFSIQAILCGSLSLTSLIISYSLIIPALYGILFLNEPFSMTSLFGILFLLISLFLIQVKKNGSNGSYPITLKWLVYVSLAFIGNGICSTVQKLHQVAYPGLYKNEFMITSMALTTVFCLISLLFISKKELKQSLHYSLIFAVPTGLANAVVNLLVMILSSRLPASFMFPVISAGGIILTLIVSVMVFKEKLSKIQLTGFAAGILSIVLLNL